MRRWWVALGLAAGVSLPACACVNPSAPPSRPSGVDVLDYLIGDASLWPRVGSQSQNQVVDYSRREVCWVKYANPRTFECWRWDDNFVYHVVDHAIDGNTGESYRFDDGKWLPRHLESGWQLTVSTRIVWFDRSCGVNSARSGPVQYHQRTWIETGRDAGGDLGVRNVLVLEYAPRDPAGGPTAAELFYFAKGAGWYAWERGGVRVVFNRIGGPARSVDQEIICRS